MFRTCLRSIFLSLSPFPAFFCHLFQRYFILAIFDTAGSNNTTLVVLVCK